ncbi:MAG: diguanylate cyclase [Capsulimonas sp.]|uniref:HD domain-containing protein n=1 Tax=Capsulimonas sp. TaxID=2494211 RepID=UPI0032637BAE
MKNDCILVVDDDALNRDLLEGYLEIAGFETRLASSGGEALAMLGPEIDLILMDVNMPGMNGFEAAERVRAHAHCSDTPIIMVTAQTAKADRLRAVEAGANDFITKPIDDTELRVRMSSVLKMKHARDDVKRHQEELEHRVAERTTELREANERLQKMLHTDPLTGLLNHRASVAALDLEIERCARYSRGCAMMIVDIDDFKPFNDSFGHEAGDSLLAEIGSVIRKRLRAIDIVGRWGGEEFIIILPELDSAQALAAAEAVRSTVGSHAFGAGEGRVTCSVGVGAYPQDGAYRAGIISVVDRALQGAKRLGRNQARVASDPAVMMLDDISENPDSQILQGEVAALAMLVAVRDCYTGRHTDDVAELAKSIALGLGLSEEEADVIGLVGQLHDIGKVGIPDAVLQKTASLSEEEWMVMRTHPSVGSDILLQMPTLQHIAVAVRAHHERWDGGGYPDRLTGEEIPLAARIVSIADSFGAITSDRPYRKGRGYQAGVEELRRCAGRQFDPTVVEAAVRVILELNEERKAA